MADKDKILRAIRKGDVEPALLATVEKMVEGWLDNPDALKTMSVRDKISVINCLTTVQKNKGSVSIDQEDAFTSRLKLVKDAD